MFGIFCGDEDGLKEDGEDDLNLVTIALAAELTDEAIDDVEDEFSFPLSSKRSNSFLSISYIPLRLKFEK